MQSFFPLPIILLSSKHFTLVFLPDFNSAFVVFYHNKLNPRNILLYDSFSCSTFTARQEQIILLKLFRFARHRAQLKLLLSRGSIKSD